MDAMSEEIEFNRLTDDKHDVAGTSRTNETSDMMLLQKLATKQDLD